MKFVKDVGRTNTVCQKGATSKVNISRCAEALIPFLENIVLNRKQISFRPA
jgi:hypothetical protein